MNRTKILHSRSILFKKSLENWNRLQFYIWNPFKNESDQKKVNQKNEELVGKSLDTVRARLVKVRARLAILNKICEILQILLK